VDIDIRDDQILRSIKACFSRTGFIHTVVAFAVSGIVLNTLSTYMEYLLRLGGSGRKTVGIVGGSFQVLVMISSIFVAKITDKTRAYYAVVIALLLLGAFALAECNISLYADHTNSLKWSLLCAAILIGPLQPVSTELAVDVSYPLCANTVLVIQQLVSNLFSALFIPLFQKLRDYGIQIDGYERPQYTFSFYLLIVIHGVATVFFATFSGKYMRLAHEQRSKNRSQKTSKSKLRSETKCYDEISYDEETASLLKS
jgi:MFS family permease